MNRSAVVRKPKTNEIPEWARPDLSLVDTKADKSAVLIERDSIEASTLNARQNFPADELRELGESMRQHGQLAPLIVRRHPRKEDKFEIVAGERRWRAAGPEYADIATLRATVGEYTDAEVRTMSLIENLMRKDLTPLEIGRQLIEIKSVSARILWDDVARMVGHKRQWVDRYVALVDAPAPVQEYVQEGKLTAAHARAVRQLEPPQQVKLARTAVKEQLTTRQLEERVRELKATEIPPKPSTPTLPATEPPSAQPAILPSEAAERRERAVARLKQCVSVMAEVAGEIMALRMEAGAFSAAYKSEVKAETRRIAGQSDAIVAALDGKRPGEA